MPDFGAWLAGAAVQDATRAHDTARTIAEKPATITVTRGSTTLSAQTVRIDTAGTMPQMAATPTAQNTAMRVVVLGYRDHPDITDTDLKRADTFKYDGTFYTVTQVQPETPGRLIAIAEAKP